MCLISTMQDYQFYYLSLSKVVGLGPISGQNLIKFAGSIEAVFDLSDEEIKALPFLKAKQKESLISKSHISLAEKELKIAESKGIKLISIESEEYPYRLKQIPDAPLVLYSRGNVDLNSLRTVAIVGTRAATPLGMDYCREIVEELGHYGATIISGMASGIDGCAHKLALKKSIPTIGVVAHGFQFRYPAANHHLFDEMEKDGMILTEYSHNVFASKENFPRRNRIVAALADAVVVVESKARGGSLITANIANDYNRDVFAVPGRLNDISFSGCNALIKAHKANLLQSVEDIAYILRWSSEKIKIKSPVVENLSELEKIIVNYLRVNDAAVFDDIAFHCGIQMNDLTSTLLNMEFAGLLKVFPGNKYVLIR